MPRHQFTCEERRRGGITRSKQDSFVEMCRKGYRGLMEKSPWWSSILENKILPYYRSKKFTRKDEELVGV